MNRHKARHNRHVTADLHPAIWKTAVGLALWYVFAAWLFFASAGYQLFALVMVSFVIFAAIGIPGAVFLTRRKFMRTRMRAEDPEPGSLRAWLASDFETWQARLSSEEAAVQILLPLAAVSIGLTVLGTAMLVATA
jgi:hypothetical protein